MSTSGSGIHLLRMLSQGRHRAFRVNSSASSPVSGSVTMAATKC